MGDTSSIRASVVIGVYNRWPALKCCLDSLRAMELTDLEIIVVDDASTDDTPAQLEAYRETYSEVPIEIVRNPENLGAAGARNLGISQARGEFVCFTDSDCTVDACWLEKLLAPFEDVSVGAVSGMVVDTPPETWAERAHAGTSSYHAKPANLIEGNLAVRTRIAREIPFDDALIYGGEGDDLARRLKASGWQLRFAMDAVVTHHHPMTLSAYLRRGFNQGKGSARYWYKHSVYIGRDVLPITLAPLGLPLIFIDWRLAVIPALFVVLQIMAVVFNELYFKRKTVGDVVVTLPVLIMFYGFRTAGIWLTLLRILLGGEPSIRRSKRAWLEVKRGIQSDRRPVLNRETQNPAP